MHFEGEMHKELPVAPVLYLYDMKDKKIKDAISGRFKNIKKYCKKIPANFAAKDIHGFRTEVKKLRAYIRLVTFVRKNFQEYKLPKNFRKIYSTSGAIRDIQLQLERIRVATENQTEHPERYEALLKKSMKKKKKQLKKLLERISIRSIQKKVLDHLPKHLDAETIRNFVQAKASDVKFLSEKNDEKDDDIHSIRKNLKDLMYNVKGIQDDDLKGAFPPALSDPEKLKAIEQLTDQLGMFTDMTAAIAFTEPSYLDSVNATEKKQLEDIRGNWLLEKNELRQAAIKDIHEQHGGW